MRQCRGLSTPVPHGQEWAKPQLLAMPIRTVPFSVLLPPYPPNTSWDHLPHKHVPKFLSQGLLLGEPQLQQKTQFLCWKGSGRETHSSRGWYEQYRGARKSEVLSRFAPYFSKSSSKRKHYLSSDYLKMFPSRMIGMELAASRGKGRKPCS